MKSRQVFAACMIALGFQAFAITRLAGTSDSTNPLAERTADPFVDQLETGSAAPARLLNHSVKKKEPQSTGAFDGTQDCGSSTQTRLK